MVKVAEADYSQFKNRLVLITPALAIKWLEGNVHNRRLDYRLAEMYASDIRSGKWLLTHQGIAFDVNGVLVDGQHRLWAIVIANKPVKMYVATGLPVSPESTNDNNPSVLDVIDGGKSRTHQQRLELGHKLKNSTLLSSAASMIRDICLGTSTRKRCSTRQILSILAIYRYDIEAICAMIKSRSDRQSVIFGTLAFVRHCNVKLGEEFAERYFSQEGLTRGHPALALRRWYGNHQVKTGADRLGAALAVASAVRALHQGRAISRGNSSTEALDWLKKCQAADVAKVCAIFAPVPGALERIEKAKRILQDKKAKKDKKAADDEAA